MPVYEFECKKCGHEFEMAMSFAERDKKKVKCPECNSTRVTQLLSTFYANTSKKS
jgi:putative FmdB family regulatory protein